MRLLQDLQNRAPPDSRPVSSKLAGIKLSSVASSLTTGSSRRILDALVAGERDPKVLAGLAHASMRQKSAQLIEAMHGRFNAHNAFMVRLHLERIDQLTDLIGQIDARINEVMGPFRSARDLLTTIPGISTTVADVIIAETGWRVGLDGSASPRSW